MLKFLKKLIRKKHEETVLSEAEYNRDYDVKQVGLERLLGPMHDMVGHSFVPFRIGGTVHMYNFTEGVPGTAFATMEIIEPDGSGPIPNRVGTYELVAFTRHPYQAVFEKEDATTPFHPIERRFCRLFTLIGLYSREVVLNPGETCEIPMGDDNEMACMVFDEFTKDGSGLEYSGRSHCLLLCIEIFRDEMEFSREHGSSALFKKLEAAGHYPYSDLDRESVV